jgi:hypothetical protein
VQQQTLQSLRTSAVRTTRACHRGGTEQSIALGPLPPLTLHRPPAVLQPVFMHMHRPFSSNGAKRGSDDNSKCICESRCNTRSSLCEYIKVRGRGLSPSSLLIHEHYMMMREVGMSSQQAISHNDARSSVACSVAFLSSSEPSSVFASAFVHHARAWSARPRLAQHLAA